jgi:branched-chain amino acid transport system substrate-binding protein
VAEGGLEGGLDKLTGFGKQDTTESTGVVTKDPNSIPNIEWQKETASKTPPSAQSTARKVTVVILLPLTGKRADLGQSMLKAAQMAMFDVGSANFDLVPKDTKSTVVGATDAAREAVISKADLILGPIFADDLKAVKTITAGSNIPVVSFSNDWNQAGNNTYIMGFLPFAQVSRVAKYAESKGYNRFAVFAPQTDYADVVIASLQRSVSKITDIKRFPSSQSDLSPVLRALVKDGATGDGAFKFNALLLPIGGEALNTTMSTLSTSGITSGTVKLIGTGLWDDTSIQQNPSLYGSWFAAPDPKLRQNFEAKYIENYGAPALRLATLAYDATALAAVLARTGDGAPYSKSHMTNARGFAGIDGVFRFKEDFLNERGLAVLEIQGGRARVIDPAPTAFISSGM